MSSATEIRKTVLAVAHEEQPKVVRVVNNLDQHDRIKEYFLQGMGWSAETYEKCCSVTPKGNRRGPDWCAAFAGHCFREACKRHGHDLNGKLCAQARGLATLFAAAGAFIPGDQVFDSEGQRIESESSPQPGDLIFWTGHVGIVRGIDTDGVLHTIEGNTWKGSQVWGVWPKKYQREQSLKKFTTGLIGFGVVGPFTVPRRGKQKTKA